MKLFQNPMSPPCRRVLATAHQLNMPLELQTVEFQSSQMQSPEYLKMNPNGAVPLLCDGDFNLWESTAIMQYLAEKKGSDLYPQDLKARADVNRWTSWSAYHFGPASGTIVWENLVKKMLNAGAPDANALKEATEDFHKYAAVLDKQLSTHNFVAGKALTLADFTIASNLMYAEAAQLPWEKYSHIKTWYKRIEATDGWKKSAPPATK
ncbi:MAG: glutathione S-transferase family protein [Bdellovibrionota bacterium]